MRSSIIYLLLALLAAPAGAALVLDAPRPVVLNWVDTATNEDGFILERQLNGGAYQVLATSTTPNLTTYNDAGVLQSATVDNVYCYRVKAFNKHGESAYSNIDCVTIKKALPLTPPAGLTVSSIGNKDTLEVSWQINDLAVTTELERRAAASPVVEKIILLAGTATFYSESVGAGRATKCYRARHVGVVTASAWSDPSCATTR